MTSLERELDELATATGFSGVVRVDALALAYGFADRAYEIPNTVETQFGIASGTKGLTALTVASLLDDGVLRLSTAARELLGDDLPLIDDAVTVEQLLAHRSGIGDYFDEELELPLDAYVMPVPVHQLASTEDYLAVLDGHEQKFPPDERFSYSNSGYVVLALLAERATGMPFDELVRARVCERATMHATAFLRSDELPARAAIGYVGEGLRSNVFHLPVRGSGDGGIYSTVDDLASFWRALFAGEVVDARLVRELVRPRSDVTPGQRYGLGFWLAGDDIVRLIGTDAGVSFHSVCNRRTGTVFTVISNTSDGARPLSRFLVDRFG